MKKTALILSIVLLLSMFPLGSSALSVNGFVYTEEENKTLTLSELEYNIANGDITVPEEAGAKSVVAIGKNAFSYKQFITSVSLPKSIYEISEGAFYMCVGLRQVVIPNGVEIIGNRCFALCESLEEVTVPHTVKSLGSGMFADCKALKTAYIYSSDGKIGEDFFSGCDSLESIYISDGINTVASSAISDCAALKDIYCQSAEDDITFEGNVVSDKGITVHYSYDYEGFNYVPEVEETNGREGDANSTGDGGNGASFMRNIVIAAVVVGVIYIAVLMIRKKKK